MLTPDYSRTNYAVQSELERIAPMTDPDAQAAEARRIFGKGWAAMSELIDSAGAKEG